MLRYGCENPSQFKEFKDKRKNTVMLRYGVEYISQNENIKEKIQESMIEKYGEVWVNQIPKYNINSIIYLDMLSEKLNLPIQHALNGGEKKFVRYYVDGYISEYNICIEWDEKQHENNKQKESDVKRESFLKENFNCQIIRINQKEFLKDVDNQINLVCNKINNFIKNNYNGKPI